MKYLVFIFAICPYLLSGQATINSILDQIQIKGDTIKNVYQWVTDNISYDYEYDMSELKEKSISREEYHDKKLLNVIDKKEGVCLDYCLLFKALLSKLGIQSHIISGYTNSRKEITDKSSHAWVAIRINENWYLYDPTWGSGYMRKAKARGISVTDPWYKLDPKLMIKTHMPYDPIWQLLDRPYTYANFDSLSMEGMADSMNYNEIISSQLFLNKVQKAKEELNRAKSLGKGNRLVESWKIYREVNIISPSIDNIRTTYNKYVTAYKNKFKKKPWTKDYALKQLYDIREKAMLIFKQIEKLEAYNVKEEELISYKLRLFERLKIINKEIERMLKMIG